MKRILLSFLVLFVTMAAYSQTETMRIVYDATKGTTALVGAEKVYMHSGANTWTAFPEGQDWGIDHGVGEMTKVEGSEDLWELVINVKEYYGLAAEDSIGNIGMVFRNADGTAEGKDYANMDIFLNGTSTDSLFALQADGVEFDGVTAQWLDDAGFVAGIEDLEVTNDMIAAPNPFSDRTEITYTTSDENVRLVIYNLVGQSVKVLKNDFHNAGQHTLTWDGTNDSGNLVTSGQYFYVMETESAMITKRLLFVK